MPQRNLYMHSWPPVSIAITLCCTVQQTTCWTSCSSYRIMLQESLPRRRSMITSPKHSFHCTGSLSDIAFSTRSSCWHTSHSTTRHQSISLICCNHMCHPGHWGQRNSTDWCSHEPRPRSMAIGHSRFVPQSCGMSCQKMWKVLIVLTVLNLASKPISSGWHMCNVPGWLPCDCDSIYQCILIYRCS